MVEFSRADLEAFRDRTVEDVIPNPLKLLFVGINPGLWTAATNTHFAHPGNRFYPALFAAGILPRPVPPTGLNDTDRKLLTDVGIGFTNLVARATARADELSQDELRAGGVRLKGFVATHRPKVVAIAGITAYRSAFGLPKAKVGQQPTDLFDDWAGAEVWVVPNPSGLNAHETVASLAKAYAEPARAAGVLI